MKDFKPNNEGTCNRCGEFGPRCGAHCENCLPYLYSDKDLYWAKKDLHSAKDEYLNTNAHSTKKRKTRMKKEELFITFLLFIGVLFITTQTKHCVNTGTCLTSGGNPCECVYFFPLWRFDQGNCK